MLGLMQKKKWSILPTVAGSAVDLQRPDAVRWLAPAAHADQRPFVEAGVRQVELPASQQARQGTCRWRQVDWQLTAHGRRYRRLHFHVLQVRHVTMTTVRFDADRCRAASCRDSTTSDQ